MSSAQFWGRIQKYPKPVYLHILTIRDNIPILFTAIKYIPLLKLRRTSPEDESIEEYFACKLACI
jgi:hypothetical protein